MITKQVWNMARGHIDPVTIPKARPVVVITTLAICVLAGIAINIMTSAMWDMIYG